ncbi:MAG TPA: hypothetical protein VF368_08465 [Gemmatimonadaceae bacterium]
MYVARQPIPYAKSGVPRYAALSAARTFGTPQGGHMKFFTLLLAASLTVPTLAVTQNAPNAAKPDPKMTFGILKANVANITAPSEKERWQANKDAWEVEISQTGRIRKVELGKMMGSLDRIKANVSKLRGGSEKERWQANIALWQLYLTHEGGALGRADIAAAKAALETMKSNVAQIRSPVERQRWVANRDLWEATLDVPGMK